MPGLGEQENPEERQGRPGEYTRALTAHRGDGQWAEELDRDGGAEWDALYRGKEGDGDQSGRDPQTQQDWYVLTTDFARSGGRAIARNTSAPKLNRSHAVPAGPTLEITGTDRAEPSWTDSIAARASPMVASQRDGLPVW